MTLKVHGCVAETLLCSETALNYRAACGVMFCKLFSLTVDSNGMYGIPGHSCDRAV